MLLPSEAKYLMLFNAIDEGFTIVDVIFNENKEPIDYLFLEANPAFIKQTKLENAMGKTMKELAPAHEEFWFRIYGEVATKGEPKRFEHYASQIAGGVWYEVYAFKVGRPEENQVAVLFKDITERKQAEERQKFLLNLSDTLRSIDDPVAIEEAVIRIVMHYFEADRCFYCIIEGDNAVINRSVSRRDLPPIAGTYPLGSFELFKQIVDAGCPFVVNDANSSKILDESLKVLCGHLAIISFIAVPVVKNDKVASMLCIVRSTPRHWSEFQVELAMETAGRLWALVEKARAEKALRQSDQKYRDQLQLQVRERTTELQAILDSSMYVMQAFKAVRNDAGKIIDFTWLFVNKRWKELYGGEMKGKSLLQENPAVIETGLFDKFIHVTETGIPAEFDHYYPHEQFDAWFHQTHVKAW